MRYFEDLHVGERIELGSVTVTEEEIITFASNSHFIFHLSRRSTRTTVALSQVGGIPSAC